MPGNATSCASRITALVGWCASSCPNLMPGSTVPTAQRRRLMGDYRIRITVRNARLLRAIEAAGYRPGTRFAAEAGISYGGDLLPYLNLTRSPLDADGHLRDSAWALCEFLRATP